MIHHGGCHCGNLRVEFSSELAPTDFEVRECQCSFCRKHGTRAVADPAGSLNIKVTDYAGLNRYTFGYETAEYLVCRFCGVYVAAVTKDAEETRGIVILNALENRLAFSAPSIPSDYDHEDKQKRLDRRAQNWTPSRLEQMLGK